MAGILDMITPEISYRKSGKQDIAGTPLKIDNTTITQHWKLGTFRLDIQPDGRR